MTFCLLMGLAQAALAAPGTMIKDEVLLAAPSASAAQVASLAKGGEVEVLARQGGWTQVRAGSRTGWVRILSVRTSVSAAGAGDLAGLVAKRDNQVVAVAGLRGLNEQELKSARFNAQELDLLERYKADRMEAEGFARAAGLESRQVAYLPDPKPAAAKSNATQQGWEFAQ
jgi:hypothetical protein